MAIITNTREFGMRPNDGDTWIPYNPCYSSTLLIVDASILYFCPLDAGAQTYPNATLGWVNVKDVANAHIQAFEIPSANGRYCLVERVLHYSEVVNTIRELYPAFELPEK